jgi:hypothetical protein
MEESTKRLMMAHVKSTLDTRRRFSAEPLEWLDSLPDAPLQMLQQYPDTFRIVFGSSSQSSPIPCPMDMTKLLAFDQTYGCRGGARNVPAAVAGNRRVLARQPSEQGPAERMATVFMSRMENIFSAMMNNGANNSGPCMGRGLSALAHSSDLGRRLPTIAFGPPIGEQLALPAPGPMLQEPVAAGPEAASLLQVVGTAASAEPEHDELAAMLDMLSARENAKQTAAKAAAAAAKAAPAAAPAAALLGVEPAAEPAAMGKAKAQSKAEAKANGKGKAAAKAKAAPPAAAMAAPPAAAKAAPPAPPAAAAKAKAKAKGKAAAMAAAPAPPAAAAKAKAMGKAAAKAAEAVVGVAVVFKLGCSKCRSALIEVTPDIDSAR